MYRGYKKQLGWWGERQAEHYLKKQGYRIIGRHWQRREGEIDIIAFDVGRNCLVFVEVKTRTSGPGELPETALSQQKIRKLNWIIDRYLTENRHTGDCRCDIIIVKKDSQIKILHFKNIAFN